MSFANLASIDSGPWPTFEIQLPQDDFNLLAWVLGEQISMTELVKSKDNYQLRGLSSEEHLLEVIVITRARGMYGIYCTEARGRFAPEG